MKNRSIKMFAVIFWGMLFASCTGTQAVDIAPTLENTPTALMESTPTKISTLTEAPSITPSSIPSATVFLTKTMTKTPDPSISKKATIKAFGILCPNSREKHGIESEISPDGNWIAAECYNENEAEESPLRVVSMDRSKDWKVYFRDYARGNGYDRDDGMLLSHWSKDGRFIYAGAGSRYSGCCWIGGRAVLLIRLNLETGQQLELLNANNPRLASTFDFKISDSDRYLMFTSPGYQKYDFAILDLQTWETQEIYLKFSKYIDLVYAAMSPDDDKIVLPLFENIESDNYEVDSIGIINLVTDEQRVLISGLKGGNALFPIRWVDANHVLLSDTDPNQYDQSSAKFWLLNIYSTKLTEAQGP